ncbi:hypothetical protein ABPG74_005214 [Tetrahymena malaccensis]
MSEAIGIMDPAYFVNKNDILKWVNNTLKLNIEKIDHLGTGAVYCQFLDMIYPGQVCMGKVNWKAKLEYEYLSNFKLVTNCLEKNDVKKHVDVNKLVKCKYQDNLEFAQWFKKFFDTKCGDRNADYDPEARRAVKISSVVEVPKVARKEEQTKQKTIAASQPSTQPANSTVKKATLSKPATSALANNNKRTLGQMYNGNSNGKPALHSQTKTTTTTTHTPASKVSNPAKTESKEYSSLINSIKEILTKGESDQEIVNKIRTLVKVDVAQKENTAIKPEEKENTAIKPEEKADQQSSSQIKQIGDQSIFKDTTNTSFIEQEN